MKQTTFYQLLLSTYFFIITLLSAVATGILLHRIHYYTTFLWSLITLVLAAALFYLTKSYLKKFAYYTVTKIWKQKPSDWETFIDEIETDV